MAKWSSKGVKQPPTQQVVFSWLSQISCCHNCNEVVLHEGVLHASWQVGFLCWPILITYSQIGEWGGVAWVNMKCIFMEAASGHSLWWSAFVDQTFWSSHVKNCMQWWRWTSLLTNGHILMDSWNSLKWAWGGWKRWTSSAAVDNEKKSRPLLDCSSGEDSFRWYVQDFENNWTMVSPISCPHDLVSIENYHQVAIRMAN